MCGARHGGCPGLWSLAAWPQDIQPPLKAEILLGQRGEAGGRGEQEGLLGPSSGHLGSGTGVPLPTLPQAQGWAHSACTQQRLGAGFLDQLRTF